MKRLLSISLVVVLFLPLMGLSLVNADVSRIKVIPYPKTAGKMASYKASFNVTRPLSANQDSITVTLPKETMVPEYVSSSVISINPQKLIGTDYKLNFATGDITFTNPLREGDMVRASFTYEAKEDYTMMPLQADVKFFDRCFPPGPPTDPRNNNGQFDPGEWVYEDRDHDGRISPGDRRLMIIHGVLGAGDPGPGSPPDVSGYDARQNSIVSAGDGDCGNCAPAAGTPSPTMPLIPLSLIRLTMMDMNNDGIYNDGDYLFDDRDQSGSVSLGDNMICGIVYYPPGTTVAFNDPDYRTRTGFNIVTFNNPGGVVYRHADNGPTPGAYDPGEAIYRDDIGTGSSQTYSVDNLDVRMTTVTIIRNSAVEYLQPGIVTNVGVTPDPDIGTRLIDFKTATGEEEGFLDIANLGFYDTGEPIYRNGTGRNTFLGGADTPQPGDIRLSSWSNSAYQPTSTVALTDADVNTQLVTFNSSPTAIPELMVSSLPVMPSGNRSPLRLACSTNFDNYTGSRHDEFGIPITITSLPFTDPFPLVPPATTATLDTWLYRDMDFSGDVTPGDIRLTPVDIMLGSTKITYSAGSTVKNGEIDFRPRTVIAGPLPLSTPYAINDIPMKHDEVIKINNEFDPQENIYASSDNIVDGTGADVRLVPIGVTSFGNKAIGSGFPLLGKTLTRGWSRIENKIIVSYAQAGTKTAKLDVNPITILPTLEPPNPPAYLKANYLTLSGGNTPLSGSGKWYIRVTAINMYGEGEPSDAIEINFPSGGSNNAINIQWRSIPFAVAYRIYKSRNETFFPASSLLAEVKTPLTNYLDRGTVITEGSLPYPYKASFITLWRSRGGIETELVEYRCADYEIDLATGVVRFRKALRPYEIVLADYKYADGKTTLGPGGDPCNTVGHKNEHVYVNTQLGIGKLLHIPAVNPAIDPLNYCFRLWRGPTIDPNNPYLLREGSDYTISYQTGEIRFGAHVVNEGDIITADYDTYEEVAGESLVEAISTGITEARASSPIIPESYIISKAVALRSSPQIRITGGENGYQLVFTTPVDIYIDPDNNLSTPDVVLTLNRPGRQFNVTNKGAVRNPEKAGNYQLWISTSQEQTPILSDPYEITADSNVSDMNLKVVSPQVPEPSTGEPPCSCKDAAANAGQAISIVTQLVSGMNGVPGIYVRFEITNTVNPPSTFSSSSLVQTNEQGLASVVLNLSATPGVTEVKVYLQDDPTMCRCVRINTGPQVQVDKIVLQPGPNLALSPGSQQLFSAKAFNTQGAEIPGVTFTWAADCGTITPAGMYTAPINTGGICHVFARAHGKEGMTTISVVTKPDRIVVTPATTTVSLNGTIQFKAEPFDSVGNPMNIPVNWFVEPAGYGSIDSSGKFIAGSIEGTATVKACSAGVCGTATVSIVKSGSGGSIDKIYITPENAILRAGETKQFTAIAKDVYGNIIQGVNFTWAANPAELGTISSSGLFIAVKSGMCIITAQAGDKIAVATVSIVQISKIIVDPATVTLSPGDNKVFKAVAYDNLNQAIPGLAFTWIVNPPTLGLIQPDGTFVATGYVGMTGEIIASVGGMTGSSKISIVAKDSTPPKISLIEPQVSGATYKTGPMQIQVRVEDESQISEVTINGSPAGVNATGNWMANVMVNRGMNTFTIRAKDNSTNKNESKLDLVIYGTESTILVMKVPSNIQIAVRNVTLTENGITKTVTFKTSPEIFDNSTFVGLRDLAESFFGATAELGGSVAYDSVNKKITISFRKSNGDVVIFETVVGQTAYQMTTVHADGSKETKQGVMDRAPYIGSANPRYVGTTKYVSRKENYNSTMVPMRAFVEALGGTVDYNADTRVATFSILK